MILSIGFSCAIIEDMEKITHEALEGASVSQLQTLCEQIREEIFRTVSVRGGHLASNLGVVELTVALHRVFDFPRDKIVFDVGHQCCTNFFPTAPTRFPR